jgi:predicted transcriptional regulator
MPATTEPTAAERVLAALTAHPGSTIKVLANYATVGESTASKALAKFEKEGRVVRREGIGDPLATRAKAPARWYLADEDQDEETEDAAEPAEPAETETPEGEPKPKRVLRADKLGKGNLRGLVEEWLDEHPTEEITPSKLGKILDRSPGAIFNALQKLVEQGGAVQTSEKPRAYKAASE